MKTKVLNKAEKRHHEKPERQHIGIDWIIKDIGRAGGGDGPYEINMQWVPREEDIILQEKTTQVIPKGFLRECLSERIVS